MRILYDKHKDDIEIDMKETHATIVYERKDINTKAYNILLDESELIKFGAYVRLPGYDAISIYFSPDEMKTIVEDNKKCSNIPIPARASKYKLNGTIFIDVDEISCWFNSIIEMINKFNTTRLIYANDESYTNALEKLMECNNG